MRMVCPPTLEQLEARFLPSTLQPISLPPVNQPPSDTAAGASTTPSVSGDGRYVVFQSNALNLITGQTGGAGNVFLLDRRTGAITLVSYVPGSTTRPAPSGNTSNLIYSRNPIISVDGRYVVYESNAPQIVGQPATALQVVVFDRSTGLNTLVSHDVNSMTLPSLYGGLLDAIGGDGRYIVFDSDSPDLVPNQQVTHALEEQLFVYDQLTQVTSLVSHAFGQNNVTANNGILYGSSPSGLTGVSSLSGLTGVSVADDGTVAYVSQATNLVGFGTIANNVYLYSPGSQTNQLISTVSGNPMAGAGSCEYAALISSDGSAVAYVSTASNLVAGQAAGSVANVFRYDRLAGTTTLVSGAGGSAIAAGDDDSGAGGFSVVISGNGQFIAFASQAKDLVAGQTGAVGNVFLYNAQSPGLTLVSGVNGSATDGAGGVPDVDVGDYPGLPGGVPDPITGNGTRILSISDDGTLVAYVSEAINIVPQQVQTGPAPADNVFLYNAITGKSRLMTGVNGSSTAAGNYESGFPALSGDGSLVAFQSLATNLATGLIDGNGVSDVFTFTRAMADITLVSRAAFLASPAPGYSFSTSVSADGRYTVFTSTATNLVPNQININQKQNIFLYDNQKRTITLINHVPGLPNTTGDGGIYDLNQPVTSRPPSYGLPVISADGNFIAFASYDDNLVPNESPPPGSVVHDLCVYLYSVQTAQITHLVTASALGLGAIEQ